jgi:glycosyltransferase involved in cell wall biosynthesis
MKKNIGILFSSSRKMGVFQYGLSIVEALVNFTDNFDFTILYFDSEKPKDFLKVKSLEKVKFVSLNGKPNNFLEKIKFALNCFLAKPIFTTNKRNREILKEAKIDLLIIPFPLLLAFENKIPYIVSVPDMMHKYYSRFAEYSFKNRIIRDIVYKVAVKHSVLTIVDSQWGSDDLQKFYKTPKEKIHIIPYLPPGYVWQYKDMDLIEANNLLKKYNLPEKFIFYPAQFWPHKNHLNLIKSIKIAEEKFKEFISLVLAGDDKANSKNYNNIMNLAEELNIRERIFHLGYVSDKEIVALYKKAIALVFPTLIGPTSIPPLEAMVLGTPVLCSNLFAMPEQVGEAGILFDPKSPEDMAEKIYKVWTDENLRKKMIEKGYQKVKNLTFENYAQMWIQAVKKALSNLWEKKQKQ